MIMPRRCGSGGRIRVYSQRDKARLKLLLRGKRLGFSLMEIKGLLDMYETRADTVPQLTRFLDGAQSIVTTSAAATGGSQPTAGRHRAPALARAGVAGIGKPCQRRCTENRAPPTPGIPVC